MELFLSLQTTPSPPLPANDPPPLPANVASIDHFHLHADEELEELSRESIELVNKPFIGMEFDTINASEEFWKRYGYETGFGVRILNSNFGKDKIVTSRTYVCSKQGKKSEDKRRVSSKPRADKRCNCGVIMRVGLSRETGKYYVKEFVEKHNHDLEGKKPIHNRRGITMCTMEFERRDRNAKSNEKTEVNHSHGLSNVQKFDILDAEFKRIIDRVVGYDDEVFEGVRRIIISAHAFMDEHTISKEKSEENISPASFEPVNIQNGDVMTGIKEKNNQKLSVNCSMVLESTLPVTSDFPEGNLQPSTSSEIQFYTPPPTDSADVASPPTAFMDDFHPHTDEESQEQSGKSGELVYKPFIGMEFDTINASELFWKKYGYETGFAVRIQNSNLGKDKIVTSRTYVCSKQGQKVEDKRRVISKPRAEKRCNCGVLMRVSLSRETGKYHVKEFVEKHNHDLEWKETIHNRRAITSCIMKSERLSGNTKSNPKVVVNHSPGLSNVQKINILDVECRRVIHRVVAYKDEVFEGVRCIINTANSFIDEHIMSKENSGENTLPPSFEPVNTQNVFMETTPAIPLSTFTAAKPPQASASADMASPFAAYVDKFLPHTEEEIEEQPEESLELVCQPFIGMEFDTINASEVFWKRYGYETGFGVRIQNSNIGKDKLVTSRTYVCSKQGQKAEDKRRVNSKPREDKRCNCGVFMRVSLSKETGKYYVKEFVEKHNHDLEGKEATHSLRAITKYTTKGWTKNANINHKVVANNSPGLSDIQKIDILDAECRQVAHRVLGYDDEVFEGVRRILNSAHFFIDEYIRSEEKREKNISHASFDPENIQNGVVVIGLKKNLNQKLSGKRRRVSLAEEELSAKKLRTVQQSNLRL